MIVRGREWSRFAAAALGASVAWELEHALEDARVTEHARSAADFADAMILERNRRDELDARASEKPKSPPVGIES